MPQANRRLGSLKLSLNLRTTGNNGSPYTITQNYFVQNHGRCG
uniref:Uncharacterized protein n=1 Tax=Arundo donax TaxID=35708 RepID=A0A0A8XPL2_ARUDO